jgi:hypothetical protein
MAEIEPRFNKPGWDPTIRVRVDLSGKVWRGGIWRAFVALAERVCAPVVSLLCDQ